MNFDSFPHQASGLGWFGTGHWTKEQKNLETSLNVPISHWGRMKTQIPCLKQNVLHFL